jgi:hypothetical protein
LQSCSGPSAPRRLLDHSWPSEGRGRRAHIHFWPIGGTQHRHKRPARCSGPNL